MKSWYEIYCERMNKTYRNHVANKYATFLETLLDTRARTSVEIGCGAGNVTRILREMRGDYYGQKYWLVDSCPKMLGLAVQNNPSPNCYFTCGDIRQLGFSEFDLIHSHGLLEHFDDYDIRRIIEKCAYSAPVQIHYVPSAAYKTPSRGDERLMEPQQWEEILGDFRPTISTFNDGHDIIIRVER